MADAADLFCAEARFAQVPMQGAQVYLLRALPMHEPVDGLLSRLIEQTPWQTGNVTLWGKRYPQPRLTAWYGDPDAVYTYSGMRLQPMAWTADLQRIRAKVEAATGAQFNSVLLNYYRDQRDSIGLHSDDEPELGAQPVIASLSLGEERVLLLKHRRDKTVKPVRIKLNSGSLLLMKGETQRNWKHGIAKQVRVCGPRVNLTFRRIEG